MHGHELPNEAFTNINTDRKVILKPPIVSGLASWSFNQDTAGSTEMLSKNVPSHCLASLSRLKNPALANCRIDLSWNSCGGGSNTL